MCVFLGLLVFDVEVRYHSRLAVVVVAICV